MGWGHACWHASAYIVRVQLAIMALLHLSYACGRGFEQQDLELRASLTEWKSSEFRSFAAVCLLILCGHIIMVMKERKALMRHV